MKHIQYFSIGSLLCCLSAAQGITKPFAEVPQAHSQYILYTGTISGKVCYNSTDDSCPDGHLHSETNTHLYVGQNPPWDTNPFFFELYQYPQNISWASLGPTTPDQLDTLHIPYSARFTTALNDCGKIWDDCVPKRGTVLYDMKKATVQSVSLGPSEPGYAVTGNASSWVDDFYGDGISFNTAMLNSADWRGDWVTFPITFAFNNITKYTYNFTFSNTSATTALKIQDERHHLTLSFKGERLSYFHPRDSVVSQSGLDGNATIELDTSDPSLPQFNYVNGSKIYFVKENDVWSATAHPPVNTSLAQASPSPTPTNTGGGNRANLVLEAGSLKIGSLLCMALLFFL